MEEERKVAVMMELLFGEGAEMAQRGAGERLRRWSEAFEAWLEEKRRKYKPSLVKQARLAWRRLLRERRKMPWELKREDIEQHTKWLREEGYAKSTIANGIGFAASFYRWCAEKRVDAECGEGFNPAEGVERPQIRRYEGATLLSRGEVRRLLNLLERDTTELGKRDYALTLARLKMGVPLRSLQRLGWGQIEQDEAGTWVRWRAEGERMRLPVEVWEAIREYLAASGRLEGMREGKFIFAPLAGVSQGDTGSKAEDWQEGKWISSDRILASLKLYGRLAGIEERKLTLLALRRTATRLRMDEGEGVREMQTFLDSREEPRSAKYRLRRLPPLPWESGREGRRRGKVPRRKALPFRAGEMIHGLYARSQAPEVVKEMMKEDVHGIEEEMVGMRILGRGLLERQEKAQSTREAVRLGDAYTLCARRLAEMIQSEKTEEEKKKKDKRRGWGTELFKRLTEYAKEKGLVPSEDIAMEDTEEWEPELEAADRRMAEEIAATRHVLRNMFMLAMETEEVEEFMRLVGIYSTGCNRLMRLLKTEGSEVDRIDAKAEEIMNRSIREFAHKTGLDQYGDDYEEEEGSE